MPKISLQKKSKNLQKAFLCMKNEDEVFCFLRDLLTEDEISEFTQRLEIAERLHNKESYKEIEKQTSVSSTTIARVSKFLKWKRWWYRLYFDRSKNGNF